MRNSQSWVIEALGGGLGHLTRSLALARRAVRRGHSVRILSNSRFAPQFVQPRACQLLTLDPGIEVVALPSAADKDQVTRAVQRELLSGPPPAVLVVDTFPRGLAGELAELLAQLPAFKVLVHRDLNPNYVRWAELESFVANYDVLLVPGEDAPLAHLPHAVRTAPWLLCQDHELLAPQAARQALGVSADGRLPVVLVSGSGTAAESQAAAEAALGLAQEFAGRGVVRFVSCDAAALAMAGELGRGLWPVLSVLRGVDLWLGAGGYNTVQEARATGTALLALAQPRLYDRQTKRLLPHECLANWREAATAVGKYLQTWQARVPHPSPVLPDGAEEAFQIIAARRAATAPAR